MSLPCPPLRTPTHVPVEAKRAMADAESPLISRVSLPERPSMWICSKSGFPAESIHGMENMRLPVAVMFMVEPTTATEKESSGVRRPELSKARSPGTSTMSASSWSVSSAGRSLQPNPSNRSPGLGAPNRVSTSRTNVSIPQPPITVSAPAWPSSQSLPRPPRRVSLPPPPCRRSSSSPPSRVSLPPVVVRVVLRE